MSGFIAIKEMTEKEFMSRFLPDDHNEQDIRYLKARYRWECGATDFEDTINEYPGTTFELNNKKQS